MQSRHLNSDKIFTIESANIDTPSENIQPHEKSGIAKHPQTREKTKLINVEMTVLKCDRWEQFLLDSECKNCYFTRPYHGDEKGHRRVIRVTVAVKSN